MKPWTKLEIQALILNYEGVHAKDLAKETGRSIAAIIKKAKKLGLKSSLRNKGNGRDNKGPNNPNWKWKDWEGHSMKSRAIHESLKRKNKKPSLCQYCKKDRKLNLANIKNHNYTRDIKDYRWLCSRCHSKLDNGIIEIK